MKTTPQTLNPPQLLDRFRAAQSQNGQLNDLIRLTYHSTVIESA